jgi:4-amino-4-deoxy-L-arabinose transferase-like glycosyltransferase
VTAILAHRLAPVWLALGFVALHVALWTAVPLLGARNLPMDAIEALAWGRQFEWGYHKHPPLSGWLAGMAGWFGREWALFLLAQAMTAGAFLAAWALARDLLPPWPAALSVAAMGLVHYHSVTGLEFNANVAQYPFWALATLSFWKAARGGGAGWWLALGVSGGLGLMVKLSFGLLPAAMAAFLLLHPQGRPLLARRGPWIALGAFLLVAGGHLVWTVREGFPTVAFAVARGGGGEASVAQTLAGLGRFLAAQTLAVGPMLALLALCGPFQPRRGRPDRDGWLLAALGLGPLAGYALAALALRIELRDMYGAPLFVAAGPLLVWALRPRGLWPAADGGPPPRLRRFAGVWALVVGLAAAGTAGALLVGPSLNGGRFGREHFPGRETAQVLGEAWARETGRPLTVVVGDYWVAGNLSAYHPDRPAVYIHADPLWAPWLDDATVAREGAVVVWLSDKRGAAVQPIGESALADLPARFPALSERPPATVTARWATGSAPVVLNWAIVPPGSEVGAAATAPQRP